jgi:hypothetical protein
MEYLLAQHGKIFLTLGAVLNAKFSRQKKVFSNHLMNNAFLRNISAALISIGNPFICGRKGEDFNSFATL